MALRAVPEGMRRKAELDRETDRKYFLTVNGLRILLLVLLGLLGWLALPMALVENRLLAAELAVFLVGLALCLLLTGLVRRTLMKRLSGAPARFVWRELFPSSESAACFTPAEFCLTVCLFPAAWAAVCLTLTLCLGAAWKWVFYWLLLADVLGFCAEIPLLAVVFRGSKRALLRDREGVLEVYSDEE